MKLSTSEKKIVPLQNTTEELQKLFDELTVVIELFDTESSEILQGIIQEIILFQNINMNMCSSDYQMLQKIISARFELIQIAKETLQLLEKSNASEKIGILQGFKESIIRIKYFLYRERANQVVNNIKHNLSRVLAKN